MKPHNEFIKDVEEASSLPAQTNKALGPESDEDKKMYKEAFKQYREKFDADGSMVEGAREALSEEAQTEEDLELISKRDALQKGDEQ